jgi:hypothetical protein
MLHLLSNEEMFSQMMKKLGEMQTDITDIKTDIVEIKSTLAQVVESQEDQKDLLDALSIRSAKQDAEILKIKRKAV